MLQSSELRRQRLPLASNDRWLGSGGLSKNSPREQPGRLASGWSGAAARPLPQSATLVMPISASSAGGSGTTWACEARNGIPARPVQHLLLVNTLVPSRRWRVACHNGVTADTPERQQHYTGYDHSSGAPLVDAFLSFNSIPLAQWTPDGTCISPAKHRIRIPI